MHAEIVIVIDDSEARLYTYVVEMNLMQFFCPACICSASVMNAYSAYCPLTLHTVTEYEITCHT